MTDILSLYYHPSKILVALTFTAACVLLDNGSREHKYIKIILLTCFLTELLVPLAGYYGLNTKWVSNLGIVCHQTIWILFILATTSQSSVGTKLIISGYLLFSALNLVIGEGIDKFNFMSFVVGAFIYLTIFTLKNIRDLREENINAFLSNRYLLLFSPVIFFFGMSFMLAFRGGIIDVRLSGETTLWTFVITYINIIYYTLINLYIYRDYKRRGPI